MRSLALKIVLAGAAVAMSAGCVSQPGQGEHKYGTFQEALSSCRHEQGGRAIRRANIPPTQPRVAACLKDHGWNPDGSRNSTEAEPR